MAKHPIPDDALDDRLGFIGTAGSGKTYNAGGAIERLLGRKARVVIVDPLGVWWGLRLLADGRAASPYDVVIFGGPHGDLPLNEHAGALIGETAATMAESCIVDLSQLGTKAADRRFMTAFLETIYRKAPGEPFHLVVDEADLFAPQKPPKGDETLLNLMEQIVRRGRVKGFIPWLISQRPAVINKNVLSQVDGLIAFKLTGSHDRDALDSWIEGQADKAQGRAIKDSLPAMQTGQGVVWVPGRGILNTVQFPPKVTFDSSRTPKRGEKKKRTATLKPLDLGALKEKLSTVEAEVKANDPKALRAELAALKRKMAQGVKETIIADPQAEHRAYAKGKIEGYAAAITDIASAHSDLMASVDSLERQLAELRKNARSIEGWAKKGPPKQDTQRGGLARLARPPAPNRDAKSVGVKPAAPSSPTVRTVQNVQDGQLTGPQAQFLRSLAWWKAMGHDAPTRVQVAAIAGWRVTSGHLKNVAGSLRTKGLIDYPTAGTITLTPEGEAVAPEPNTATELQDSISSILTGPQRQVFEALLRARTALSRDEVARACGWEPTSGHVKNVLGSMRSLEVITYPSQGQVALDDWVLQ